MSGVSAIVLAAGSGSRFGGGKLLAPFGERPLIAATLSGLRGAPVDEIIVVVGAEGERLRSITAAYKTRIIENPDWAEGMSTSVRAGLRACTSDARAAVVCLADQPLVGAVAVERLVEAFEQGATVTVATYGGEMRNPVLFARGVWPLLLREMSGDRGARVFLKHHREVVTEVSCDDVADPADIDTVEDLRRLEGDLKARERGRTIGQRRD
jgi:CTP:molybdopterin cytidylyltransferase MocA